MRAWSKSYAAGQDRLLEIGYRLSEIGFIERETELWRKQVKFLPYAQFSVNNAIRVESIEALQKVHSQRLDREDSATKAEAENRLRSLASALKKKRRERTEEFRSDGSTKYAHSGPMPSSPTKQILVPKRRKCTFPHFLKDEADASDLPCEVECTCIVCLGSSKHGKDNCTIVIDQQPRWTKTMPPGMQQLWKI